MRRLIACLALLLAALAAQVVPGGGGGARADTTQPALQDTDNDGYLDGPDRVVLKGETKVLRRGEDKNGKGRLDPLGADGLPETADDESDPNDSPSRNRRQTLPVQE